MAIDAWPRCCRCLANSAIAITRRAPAFHNGSCWRTCPLLLRSTSLREECIPACTPHRDRIAMAAQSKVVKFNGGLQVHLTQKDLDRAQLIIDDLFSGKLP